MERMEINGIIWDCRIDGNRFFGYMPVSAIVRLCRNIAKVEVKKDGSYYSSRSTSGAAAGSLTAGTRMAIRGTSVDSDGKEWGVIRRGSKFYYVPNVKSADKNSSVVCTKEP